MNLNALIFDVDGTLADTEEAHRLAFNAAFAQHALPWDWSRERYAELLKPTGGKERIAAYLESLDRVSAATGSAGTDSSLRDRWRAQIPQIHAAKTAFYTHGIRDGALALRPGVRRLIEEARTVGVRLAIASTTTRANVEALLATVDAAALGWFDVIAVGDDAARKKPAPDIYQVALERLRLSAADCVAFEDSAHGVRAAQGAGLFTVVTPTFWTRSEDLAAADLVLDTLGDPGQPLGRDDADKVGGPILDLAALARLHAVRRVQRGAFFGTPGTRGAPRTRP